MKAQPGVMGAVENHVGLVLDCGGGAHVAGALVRGGPSGLGQVAFTFNAKVMATGAEAGET